MASALLVGGELPFPADFTPLGITVRAVFPIFFLLAQPQRALGSELPTRSQA